jgi:hypothetical protein
MTSSESGAQILAPKISTIDAKRLASHGRNAFDAGAADVRG